MTRNVAASVRQRLLNHARAEDRPFNEVLQYFALERFLYRLGRSSYRRQFVLKGALMFTVWQSPFPRPTRDIDLLGHLDNAVKTTISNRELDTRARAVLNKVHDFLDGNAAASSEKAYDWMQFCYALSLYRETAALFAFVFQDDLPEWAYERARKMAEACRARMG